MRVSPGIKNFDWYKAHVILRRMEVLVKAATIAKRRSTDAGFIGDDGLCPNWAVTRYHIWKDIASLRHGPFNIIANARLWSKMYHTELGSGTLLFNERVILGTPHRISCKATKSL